MYGFCSNNALLLYKSFICNVCFSFNPLSANPSKWSNTQTIRRQQPTNYLSLFDHFVGLALKGLTPFDTWDCYYFESQPDIANKSVAHKKSMHCFVVF